MVFGVGQFNGIADIYLQSTVVAIATKCWNKLAIRYLQDFCVYEEVFKNGLSTADNRIFFRPTLVATAKKLRQNGL